MILIISVTCSVARGSFDGSRQPNLIAVSLNITSILLVISRIASLISKSGYFCNAILLILSSTSVIFRTYLTLSFPYLYLSNRNNKSKTMTGLALPICGSS